MVKPKNFLTLAICILLHSSCLAQKETFFNPILPGFYPDPSICRVGDNFYLINSTFAYFPGVPVFQSTDLVHWKQIGNILNRPGQLNLDGHGVSRGIFAPSIHYHNGVFYMVTTLIDTGGNFVVTATDPAGPWSNPVFLPDVQGIDPSLFFDDNDKAYIIFNSDPPEKKPLWSGHRALWMYEFDKQNLKTVGEIKLVVDGGVDVTKKPVWIEGPHIYKIKDYYYLMAAEGGTGYNHSEVIFRTKSLHEPFVPFDKNPILTQRHLDVKRKYPITTTGHADLIETKDGEWWAVFLGCRPYEAGYENYYNIGRETFLAPVTWKEGWPIINADFAEVQYKYPLPKLPEFKDESIMTNGNFTMKEDFNEGPLDHYWLFLRTPREKWYNFSDKKGRLTLLTRPQDLTGKENPSLVTRRQQHLFCEVAASVEFDPVNDSEIAGLTAFQNETFHYLLGKTRSNGQAVVKLLKAGKKENSTTYETLAEIKLTAAQTRKPLFLKIEGKGNEYAFYYAFDPGKWIVLKDNVDGKYLSTQVAEGFVGTTIGMYTSSNGKPSTNNAAFDWFTYKGNDPVYNDKDFLSK
jgi:xylan 1,4-beta-xylosidase